MRLVDRTSLLQLRCPWDARDGDTIGLRMIEFNRTRWEADPGNPLVIPDGGRLIIRRIGRDIFISDNEGK